MFLTVLWRSFESFGAGSIPTIGVLFESIVDSGTTMLVAGLRLAAPMLAAFLALMVALGVLARIAPEMNILFISFPLRIGLGLIMVAAFMGLYNAFIKEMADWMGKLLPLGI